VTPDLASPEAVARHLSARGLVAAGVELRVTPLAGGVSNDVFDVEAPGVDLVVKRALGRLRVAGEWHADPGRIAVEARAMAVVARLVPDLAPRLVDLHDGVLVMRRAPRHWVNWRDELLGDSPPGAARMAATAAGLGTALAAVHRASAADPLVLRAFADRTNLDELRVEPFYREAARANPDVAERIDATLAAMLARQTSLVHGDFSPKNILVHGTTSLLLDWEVAHTGDPSFDIAFLLTHLLLKAVHRPELAGTLAAGAEAFRAGYGGADTDAAHVAAQVGCLLLARVDGRSPANYLSEPDRIRVRALARRLLNDPEPSIATAWQEVS
jgi:aminoglycoside phosphotransferase (APT) family kinase protein